MNYNFKANWNDVILPLLSLPIVKRSIKRGIIGFLNSDECMIGSQYNCKKCPASYERADGWVAYIDDYEEKLTTKLLETGILKPDENEPHYSEEGGDICENYVGSPEWEKYREYKEKILKPFLSYHEKTALRAYQMFHACHWWNPTFCLTLAKIVYPNEVWQIRTGSCPDKSNYHTTVVNLNERLVFDILYFDEDDETKGGKSALYDST